MFEIFRYDEKEKILTLKLKSEKKICPFCNSENNSIHQCYYSKEIDLKNFDLNTDTKVILYSKRIKCKNCNKIFYSYKMKDIDFNNPKYFNGLLKILINEKLINFENIKEEEKNQLKEFVENENDWFVVKRENLRNNQFSYSQKIKIINIKTLETRILKKN